MKTNISPAYLLRAYIWQVLKSNFKYKVSSTAAPAFINEAQYGGLIPIVPLAEEPDLAQYTGPHIVYGFATNMTQDPPALRRGSMSFTIYHPDYGIIQEILNIMIEAFSHEHSARDINEYTSTIGGFVGCRFGLVEIGFTEGGTPEQTEGGRQSGFINLRFDYFIDYEVNTRPVITNGSVTSWQ